MQQSLLSGATSEIPDAIIRRSQQCSVGWMSTWLLSKFFLTFSNLKTEESERSTTCFNVHFLAGFLVCGRNQNRSHVPVEMVAVRIIKRFCLPQAS